MLTFSDFAIIKKLLQLNRHFRHDMALAQNGLTFEREYEMDIYYKGERIGGRRVDFFVEGEIMVELNAGKPSESRNKKSSKSH